MNRQVAAYGSWTSPIAEEKLVEGRVGLGGVAADGDAVYWIESRPQEGGRNVIVRETAEGIEDVLPPGYNARTTVHEYGGGSMLVSNGVVFFSNFEDQRIYRVVPGQAPQALTPAGKQRYAEFLLDRRRNRLISVRENHDVGEGQAVNELVAIALEGTSLVHPEALPADVSARVSVYVLAGGYDFYASPRLDETGRKLAWVCWRHPNMPWDHTELWLADLDERGELSGAALVAGADEESIFQPEWGPDGRLFFVSDRDEWWNLYAYDGHTAVALHPKQAEFGKPQWGLGMRTFDFKADGGMVVTYGEHGTWFMAGFDAKTGSLVNYRLPFTAFGGLTVKDRTAYFVGGSPDKPGVLVALDLGTGQYRVIKRTSQDDPDPRYTSQPEAVRFPTGNNQEAYGFYYPPHNEDFVAPEGTKPPMITIVHGGPTSATSATYALSTQYWTSRGFAVFDLNHGGSTGYGRSFRNRLRGQWGIVDVEDAARGAGYLAEQGKADRDKLIIRGGSAGGYTTLAALAFHDTFSAGASYYGISDLSLLAVETHKFESRYPETLIAPWPEGRAVYEARSPIKHLEGLNRPVILLQGLEDKVVPPNQAELIVEALKDRGVPVAYLPFPGEQHGFRKAENIIRAYRSELYFYGRVLGFAPPEGVPPVEIHNL